MLNPSLRIRYKQAIKVSSNAGVRSGETGGATHLVVDSISLFRSFSRMEGNYFANKAHHMLHTPSVGFENHNSHQSLAIKLVHRCKQTCQTTVGVLAKVFFCVAACSEVSVAPDWLTPFARHNPLPASSAVRLSSPYTTAFRIYSERSYMFNLSANFLNRLGPGC